jgi:hypothetical protein
MVRTGFVRRDGLDVLKEQGFAILACEGQRQR